MKKDWIIWVLLAFIIFMIATNNKVSNFTCGACGAA